MGKFKWVLLGLIGLFLFCLRPAITGPAAFKRTTRILTIRQLNAASQVFQESGEHPLPPGFPAESHTISKTEYLQALVQNNYLQLRDLTLPDDLVLANVSKDDPPDTVFAVSQGYYDRYILKKKRGWLEWLKSPFHEDLPMVITKSGGGNFDHPLLPPRTPAFLPP